VVNHFKANACITTKAGLSLTLLNLHYYNNKEVDSFFPKCYRLNNIEEKQEFIEEYKACKAESVLKRLVIKMESK